MSIGLPPANSLAHLSEWKAVGAHDVWASPFQENVIVGGPAEN